MRNKRIFLLKRVKSNQMKDGDYLVLENPLRCIVIKHSDYKYTGVCKFPKKTLKGESLGKKMVL